MEKEKLEEYVQLMTKNIVDDENSSYIEEEKDLIRTICNSDIDPRKKFDFLHLLKNYIREQIRVENLEKRLKLSYTPKTFEDYINKIVCWNPKLGYIGIQAGETGRDEKNDYSLHFTIEVKEEDAEAMEDRVKRVMNIILIDAKKMRII